MDQNVFSKQVIAALLVLLLLHPVFAEDGYQLWLRYNLIEDETLLDAYEHPDQHKTLLVRVAGYSAFFNDLSDPTKLDIIGRTELSFD